jgi:hypothetical protein
VHNTALRIPIKTNGTWPTCIWRLTQVGQCTLLLGWWVNNSLVKWKPTPMDLPLRPSALFGLRKYPHTIYTIYYFSVLPKASWFVGIFTSHIVTNFMSKYDDYDQWRPFTIKNITALSSPHYHLRANCLENVEASTSHNPMSLHSLLQG